MKKNTTAAFTNYTLHFKYKSHNYDRRFYLLQLSYSASCGIQQYSNIALQNAELSNEFVIYKKLVHVIDIHHKEMESVFIIAKYHNLEIIDIMIS